MSMNLTACCWVVVGGVVVAALVVSGQFVQTEEKDDEGKAYMFSDI